MKFRYSILAITLASNSLSAAPIAKKSGYSGFISGGILGFQFKSNMIAGNALDSEISNNDISNLNNEPSKESSVIPSFTYELKYTFAEAKTEIFLGTNLEDLLTFDNTGKFGVRKKFDGLGTIGASALFTTLPSTVWKDPYDTSKSRQSTGRSSLGISLKWEGIIESKFDFEVRLRNYDIEGGDQSGLNAPYTGEVAHGLTNSQLNNQLNREGRFKKLIATYNYVINRQNILKPSLRFSDYSLDGQAMQHKRTSLKLDYLHLGAKWVFIATAIIGQDDYENKNPLFAKEADSNVTGVGLTAGYKNPFGWSKKLSLLGTIATYNDDSDINFYDTSIAIANFSILYRF